MWGNATLATEESSTTMKVASITETATHQGFTEGFQSRCSASVRRFISLEVLIRLLTGSRSADLAAGGHDQSHAGNLFDYYARFCTLAGGAISLAAPCTMNMDHP
jgi:hypothetical protein